MDLIESRDRQTINLHTSAHTLNQSVLWEVQVSRGSNHLKCSLLVILLAQWFTHILQYNEHWSDSGLGGRWGENRGLCVFVCTPTTTPATASAPPLFPILSHPTLNPNILWVRYFFFRPDFHKTETSHSVVHCSCTTIIPHLIQPNPQYPLNLILFWNHFLQDWDITPPPPPATTPAPPLFPILSHSTPNILWLQKIYKTEISYFAVHLVNCPTRWSLLLIFGFPRWSSSWWLGPHVGVCT